VSESLIYRSARGYELLMRILYGRHYVDRMRAVAEQVPQGSSVLELCCGPGTLYERFLKHRAGSYIGLDVNEGFVNSLRRKGVDARVTDLFNETEPLPGAEVALIHASLYHFLPDAHKLVDRMLTAASERAIVAEPVRNLASSNIPVISLLGRRGTDPGTGEQAHRFTEESLRALMARYSDRLLSSFPIPGGREQVYVLRAG
jgi:SAM-dependent methyltransferase